MAKIKNITARIIQNSRGEETIEATVFTHEDMFASASVPMGKSRGKFEAVCVSADEAAKNVIEKISPTLQDMDPEDQASIDKKILDTDGTEDKSVLGGNTTLAVSLACARLGAKTKNVYLWQHIEDLIGEKGTRQSPRLLMNLINGGLHAENNLDFQEYMVIPVSNSAEESLQIGLEIYKKLLALYPNASLGNEGGVAPDFQNSDEPLQALKETAEKLGLGNKIELGIDAAASNIQKSKDVLTSEFLSLISSYPNLVYIEDPFPEEDFTGFAELRNQIQKSVVISGDDLTVTNPTRIEEAKKNKSVNGIIIKPNQIGTLTETLTAIKMAKANGWKVVVAHRSGETEDDFIADLGFGVSAWGLKAGAPGPKERMTKYIRLLEIESKER